MFQVGKEYWIVYGTTEDQSIASAKVIEVQGLWLHIESDALDSHINLAAPMFISARERDRQAEEQARGTFEFSSAPRESQTGKLAY